MKTPEGCLGILSAYQLAISKFSPNVGNFHPIKELCEREKKQVKQTCLDSHGLMSIGQWKSEQSTATERNVDLHVLEAFSESFLQLEEPDMTRGLNYKGKGNTENIIQLTGQKHVNTFYTLFLK